METNVPPPDRMGDYLETFTGRRFWPLDPRPEEVCIADIAHALSQLCRFGGHTRQFYSVAEHSVLVVAVVKSLGGDKDAQRQALLHDATEAYLVDVPRPIKRYLPDYQDMEARLHTTISKAFGLDARLHPVVHEADELLLGFEGRHLMPGQPDHSGRPWYERYGDLPGWPAPVGWTPHQAQAKFTAAFKRLFGKKEGA